MSEIYIEKAAEEKAKSEESEMNLEQFLSYAQDNPMSVADSVNYLLEAIEHFGTRSVFENGEEKERYCFFDDPYQNGEHAILGNTEVLNDFVDELRRRASEEGDNDKIIWFLGPTATGKSELKRCIINGLKGFSESEEGAKYTLEWTLDNHSEESRMSYGEGSSPSRDWYKSPVNTNPLSLLPEKTREEYIQDLDKDIDVDADLDPFSRESMEILEDRNSDFQEIIDSGSVRVSRYYPEVGDGIGVLHTEDGGKPKEKLVGSWMQGAMEKFAKRGQKNPQAFSYDGVLSQGNGLVSIVEDAGHHSDVLDKMLNVCEEEMVKLDNKIAMEIDTLFMIFSNPDLEGQLEEYAEAGHEDPLRALRRRLDKYNFGYLTTLSIEAMLIKRLLQNENFIWDDVDNRMEKVSESFELHDSEIAPRVVEAAAMYEIITRLEEDAKTNLTAVNEAKLLEHGEVQTEKGDKLEVTGEDYDLDFGGRVGIPVTYTVDKIVELSQENDVVLPSDAIEEMCDRLVEEPVFSDNEVNHFGKMSIDVEDYIHNRQEEDVLEAMVGDIEVTEEDVREYIDGLLAWEDDNEDEYDAYELKEFETRYLGQSDEDYWAKADPSGPIINFREEIILPINKYMWDQRDEDFKASDVPISESPPLEPLLQENDWDTVKRVFPDSDLAQWESPPENTETEELKEKTINRMVDMLGYSEDSAEEVSKKIVSLKNSVDAATKLSGK